MINCTVINSVKEAPPKQRIEFSLGRFKCARCGKKSGSLEGSRFVMLGGYKRRVCGKCGGVTK